jgi:hypothetical protein
MLTLFLHSKTAWNDNFPGTNSPNYNSQTFTSTQNSSVTNVYVLNCLFKSISASSDGGALYCTSATYFLVESSSFFLCKTSGAGGAICFSNSNGQSVLYKVCGYDCCTTSSSYYQFFSISVNNVATSKNYVNYSTISRCVNENSNAYHTLGHGNGNVCYPSVNSSINKCYGGSGMTCWPTSDSNSVTCLIRYSTFADNHANLHICFWLNTAGAKYEIKNCNILRNTQGSLNTNGIIYIGGNAKIEDSCILENKADRIFFQSYSYTITLSNSTVDSTSNNGYLTTQNTATKSFIFALNHMSTENCHSKYDSAAYLTPIIQTSKKEINCCTIGNFLHLSQLSDFFSLHSIFLFNFIHLPVSNYH